MGIDQAASEATRQGVVKPKRADAAKLASSLSKRAVATDNLLASSLGQAAQRQAIRLTANDLDDAVAVADKVSVHLRDLSPAYLEAQMNGALTSAMNDGRKATIGRNNPVRIYSSELLDEATCENCTAVDGTEYTNMDDANGDYPTGGYFDCLGMERCRGTLVAVYEESAGTPQ